MAPRIPTYQGPQERVMQLRPMEDAALKETRNMMGTISQAVDQMAKFAYKQEAREAEQRGFQRVADEGAQPVLQSMKRAGGPTNIEERAAVEAANRIASAELETQAILEMNTLLAAGEKQEMGLADFNSNLDDIIDGFPAALSDLNPMVAGELRANLEGKASVIRTNYADYYHKKAMKEAQGRALVGIDTRQQAIYQLAASNSPMKNFMVDRELRSLQSYMQNLQFGEDQVARTFLETRNQAVEEGIRFEFSELPTVKDQMDFIAKLVKSPPKQLGRENTQKIVTNLKTQMNTGMKVLKGQVKNAEDRIADLEKVVEAGGNIQGAELTRLETELSNLDSVLDTTTGQPITIDARKKFDELKAVNVTISTMRQLPPEQAQLMLDELQGGISGAGEPGIDTTLEVATRDAAQKLVKNIRTNLERDGMTHASTVGLVQLQPLAFSGTPEEVDNSIQKRRADYQTVKAQYPNANINPLTFAETSIITNAIENGTINDQMMTLGSIVQGFRQDAPQVLEHISKKSAVLGHVGGLMLLGRQDTARLVLEGISAAKDGAPMPTDITRTDINLLYREEVSSALTGLSDQVDGAGYEAAAAILRSKMGKSGMVSKPAAADRDFQSAINMAFGGDGDMSKAGRGGIRTVRDRQVLLPPDMSADQMEFILTNMTVEQFKKATGVDVDSKMLEEIKESDDIFPLATSGNTYQLVNGNQNNPGNIRLLGVDNVPFEINMDILAAEVR